MKASLETAQEEVASVRQEAANAKEAFRKEGYNLGKQEGYDLRKKEGVEEFMASADFAQRKCKVAIKAVEDFKSSNELLLCVLRTRSLWGNNLLPGSIGTSPANWDFLYEPPSDNEGFSEDDGSEGRIGATAGDHNAGRDSNA